MDLSKPIWKIVTIGIASLLFIVLGAKRAEYPQNDFAPVYKGAVCLWSGCNPYGSGELLYPPSTLLVTAPLAVFQYRIAWSLWFLGNAALFIVAAGLVVALCPREKRWVATILTAVLVAGSSQLLIFGQPSTLSISLLGIGVYCLLQRRMPWLGAVLLMISLAVKPQIGGLVVVYLLFMKAYRRYAVVAFAGAAVILLCGSAILNAHPESSHWVSGLSANLSSAVAPGATNDPRPNNEAATAAINLQTVTSVFFEQPKMYNDTAYAVVAILLMAWAAINLREKSSINDQLVSIGTLSIITLLPVYHRAYDTRLLILFIPAAVIVLERRRIEGILLCVLTALATVSIQHWVTLALHRAGLLEKVMTNKLWLILLLRETNLRLLLLAGLIMVAAIGLRRTPARQTSSVGTVVEVSTSSTRSAGSLSAVSCALPEGTASAGLASHRP